MPMHKREENPCLGLGVFVFKMAQCHPAFQANQAAGGDFMV